MDDSRRWQGGIDQPEHPEYRDIHRREHRTEPEPGNDPVRRLVRDQQASAPLEHAGQRRAEEADAEAAQREGTEPVER